MATMSDLPGAGRALGKLYSRGGKILEHAISRLAHRLGYGPFAAFERMTSGAVTYIENIGSKPVEKWSGELDDLCMQSWYSLLKYAR